MKKKLVIIGGGQAAISLISRLRNNKFEGSITIICEEPYLPYQRPPLSKAYLLDKIKISRLFLKPENYYKDQNICMRLGVKATSIDRQNKVVVVGSERLPYDDLVIAAGSTPNELPAALTNDVQNVFTIRKISDVKIIKEKLPKSKKVLIIGGGYIGLEAAAVFSKKGLKVKLVEASGRILQRVSCKETANFLKTVHLSKGVDICESMQVRSIHNQKQKLLVTLSSNSTFECDLIVVGIGVKPNTELASECGLKLENGILTNSKGQTSDENIWAIGDCASFPLKNEVIRLESVGHAIDHAETIAENLTGSSVSYVPKPWFWSDQYEIKLQIAGLNNGYTDVIVRKNNNNSISFWYYKEKELLAVDAINAPRDYMVGKRLIESCKHPKKEIIKDPKSILKTLLV